jgi:tetratricopeptide (TPR) repeat protein
MINPRAEESFRNGRQLLDAGRPREALAFLKSAIELELTEDRRGRGQARYLSYYGLGLCLTRNGMRDALNYCRKATEIESFSPDLWWNLGRVALTVRRKGEAHRAFRKGLSLEPGHTEIRQELKRMGVRRGPVLSFLSRTHPMNVALGRMRAKLRPAGQPAAVGVRVAETGVGHQTSPSAVSQVIPLSGS